MDNFGIKYTHKKDADHLISALQAKYELTQDWTGGLYCGIKFKWDYKKRQLDISITGYMKDALHKFHHPTPTRPQHSTHQWKAPNYGSTAPHMAHPEDDSPELNPEEANTFQQVAGIFLYYTRVVYPTILVALNTVASHILLAGLR